jgi:hypothetical protein
MDLSACAGVFTLSLLGYCKVPEQCQVWCRLGPWVDSGTLRIVLWLSWEQLEHAGENQVRLILDEWRLSTTGGGAAYMHHVLLATQDLKDLISVSTLVQL